MQAITRYLQGHCCHENNTFLKQCLSITGKWQKLRFQQKQLIIVVCKAFKGNLQSFVVLDFCAVTLPGGRETENK